LYPEIAESGMPKKLLFITVLFLMASTGSVGAADVQWQGTINCLDFTIATVAGSTASMDITDGNKEKILGELLSCAFIRLI
jgi:hypothetical protein